MGHEILERVLEALNTAGFSASAAYPGQKFPRISGTVAAVHLEKVDWANGTVTVDVSVLSPAAMGGSACEGEAVQAAEALRQLGAVCVQDGCCFDSGAQVYTVRVLARFSGSSESGNEAVPGTGFLVFADGQYQKFVRSFSSEVSCGTQAEYAMGEPAPLTVRSGTRLWTVRMEELVPMGEAEPEEPAEGFELEVRSGQNTETFRGCCWKTIRREYSQEGVKRIRQGIARERVEVTDGNAAV